MPGMLILDENNNFCALLCFPNAKINLGLRVMGRRDDGYHALSSFFLPVGLCDVLEILPGGSGLTLETSGLKVEGPTENNLVRRAWRLLQERHSAPGARMWLHKAIPSGAGLGGGSSDAAATLRLGNALLQLGLDEVQLESLALELGSDCPFFIRSQASLVGGRGEKFSPVPWPGAELFVVILKPPSPIPTAEAFRNLISFSPHSFHQDDLLLPFAQWQEHFRNDFEGWASERVPQVGELILRLKSAGAFFTSMSGSGSSVFGLFHAPPEKLEPAAGEFRWQGWLSPISGPCGAAMPQ